MRGKGREVYIEEDVRGGMGMGTRGKGRKERDTDEGKSRGGIKK